MRSREKKLSIIVPVLNEEGSIRQLHEEIMVTIQKNDLHAEIIFIDDGSHDKTLDLMKKLHPLKMIVFRKNFGQTAAMDAGIKMAEGDIIIALDADLQNDPADIPKLLDKMDEGCDVVSGWRKHRKDPQSKKMISKGADKLRKILINDGIHDSGCTLKAYKKEVFENVDLYGEMHRFIPAIVKINGFIIGETVVNHRPRTSGQTKYNYKRVVKGFLDMTSVWFWRKFSSRPLHLFGSVGLISGATGVLILAWMAISRLFFGVSLDNRIWPIIGIFLILMGIQLFISGLLADISVKIYHQAKKEQPYSIKKVIINE